MLALILFAEASKGPLYVGYPYLRTDRNFDFLKARLDSIQWRMHHDLLDLHKNT